MVALHEALYFRTYHTLSSGFSASVSSGSREVSSSISSESCEHLERSVKHTLFHPNSSRHCRIAAPFHTIFSDPILRPRPHEAQAHTYLGPTSARETQPVCIGAGRSRRVRWRSSESRALIPVTKLTHSFSPVTSGRGFLKISINHDVVDTVSLSTTSANQQQQVAAPTPSHALDRH